MIPNRSFTGPSLRRARLRAGVTATSVARVMGVTRQRATTIEASAAVPPATAARYLTAISEAVRERDGAG